MSLTSPLIEEDIQVALLLPLLTAALVVLVHFNLMFQAELPPEPIADLIASFADLDVDDLSFAAVKLTLFALMFPLLVLSQSWIAQ